MTKYALVTGGTKGIGKAVANDLAKLGYHLILTFSNDESVAQLESEVIQTNYKVVVHSIKADISNRQSIDTLYRFLQEKEIKIDAIVLNAGLTYRSSFEDLKLDEWERMFFANVHFPVFLLQKIIHFINPGSSVVFTGSLMGIQPHATSLSYGVTKACVHALTKNLVKFLTPYAIRVNAVAPGFVDTDWQKSKPIEIRQSIESKIAMSRFCLPEEIAEVYMMLIHNSYFNGEVIVVDGGYSYK